MNIMELSEMREEARFGKRYIFDKQLASFLMTLNKHSLPQVEKGVRRTIREMVDSLTNGEQLTRFYGWRQFKLQAKRETLPVLSLFIQYAWRHPYRKMRDIVADMLDALSNASNQAGGLAV